MKVLRNWAQRWEGRVPCTPPLDPPILTQTPTHRRTIWCRNWFRCTHSNVCILKSLIRGDIVNHRHLSVDSGMFVYGKFYCGCNEYTMIYGDCVQRPRLASDLIITYPGHHIACVLHIKPCAQVGFNSNYWLHCQWLYHRFFLKLSISRTRIENLKILIERDFNGVTFGKVVTLVVQKLTKIVNQSTD